MTTLQRSRGLSLVELMVAIAIGLGMLAGLAVVFSNSSRSQAELTKDAQQIENGRYAVQVFQDSGRHAGYYGYYFTQPTAPTSLPDPCLTDATSLRTALALPVQGYDSWSSTPISCLPAANFVSGTDVLVIRRVSTAATAPGSLNASLVYLQSNTSSDTANPIVALGTGTFNLTVRNGTGTPITAPIRQYFVHIYFVSPCSVPTGSGGTVCQSTDDGGTPIPTLKRLELSGSTFNVVPLVEGVRNFQVDYGIDTDNQGTPNGDWVTVPATVAAWQNVMGLRISILAQNTQPSSGFTDTKTYSLGKAGTVGPFPDAYRKHVYTAIIRLNNPAGRRETPS